jgi:hypothetical protein
MLSRWEELYAPEDAFDVHEEMMRVTLDVISSWGMRCSD